MEETDAWRTQVLELMTSYTEPVQVVLLLVCFSLGMFSIRALA